MSILLEDFRLEDPSCSLRDRIARSELDAGLSPLPGLPLNELLHPMPLTIRGSARTLRKLPM